MKTTKRKQLEAHPSELGYFTMLKRETLYTAVNNAAERGVKWLYIDDGLGVWEKRPREVRTTLLADLSGLDVEYIERDGKELPSEWLKAERAYVVQQSLYEFFECISAQTNPFWDCYFGEDGWLLLHPRGEEN
ncbi:MAG: hypothetical protein LUE08_07055 [Akkermansiaceae bacterium]|nr:hypothetical protein [Akkermansiaceae bacterium]